MGISVVFDKVYSQYYEIFNQDKPYKKEIEFVYRLAGKPKSIYDIGCGTANYWGFFPKNVFISGVEKSRDMGLKSKFHEKIAFGYDVTELIPHALEKYDLATALFDVINYIQKHYWWKTLPIKKDGFFVFDIWDKEKVDKDGFRETFKRIGNVSRRITPSGYDGKSVSLKIEVFDGDKTFSEIHKMYVYSQQDIEKFCGDEFEIVEVKETKTWQHWFKLRKLA